MPLWPRRSVVQPPRRHPRTVRGDGHRVYFADIPVAQRDAQGALEGPVFNAPDLDRLVVTAGDQPAALGVNVDALDRGEMALWIQVRCWVGVQSRDQWVGWVQRLGGSRFLSIPFVG